LLTMISFLSGPGMRPVRSRSQPQTISQAYTKNFGLPRSCASDSHNLASLIFALQLNASAVVGQSNDAATNRNQVHGSSDTPSLKQVEMHGLLVTFDSSGRLLLALFVSPSLGPKGILNMMPIDHFACPPGYVGNSTDRVCIAPTCVRAVHHSSSTIDWAGRFFASRASLPFVSLDNTL
jgi:hypothetical protein